LSLAIAGGVVPLGPIGLTSLDLRVGLRMLARYPVLTAVGTLAMAVAVALGTIYFEAIDKVQNPRLPIVGAERVVSLHQWDVSAFAAEPRTMHDFAAWRDQVRTIEEIGAAMAFQRNLATEDGQVETVVGAEVTASAFRLMGTAALHGRTLLARDEGATEPLVVVLGHSLWESRFHADPGVIGRTLRVGSAAATVVGVMPPRFAFPRNQQLWIPLRTDGASLAPRSGPPVEVFGRLAVGASIEDARAELDVIAARLSADLPATHEHLRPRVAPYGKPLLESGERAMLRNVMYAANGVFLMLLAIMCANVATLVFARTATRSWELTVRSALGASRGRIIRQLFAEALVLTGLATVVGLLVAKVALRIGVDAFAQGGSLPFWIDAGLSWRTILYAAGLALFGAAIVGILPALRATRVNVQEALRGAGTAGATLKFGGFWTAIIVVQVAVTVLFLPLAAGGAFESNRFSQRAKGIGAERYMTATIGMDREEYVRDSAAQLAHSTRGRLAVERLEQRLREEPGVEGVAFADRLPVEDQFKYRIEIDTVPGAPATDLRTSTLVHVSQGFFDAFGTRILAGRSFEPMDFESGRVMLVNRSFARNVLGQEDAIGRRVRIVGGEVSTVAGETWYEIVGMVADFGWQLPRPEEQAAMYLPSVPIVGRATQLAVRAQDPEAVATRMRIIAAEVDPTLRLSDVKALGAAGGGEARGNWILTAVAWLVGLLVMLLSAMGIHALMSFTVTRRTREIGVRVALGAGPGRIVSEIFRRAFLQVTAGLVIGSGLATLVGLRSPRGLALLLGANALMFVVGMAACALPVRRALRIAPSEALRTEG
jgi:putative ABC transport system permease protein